PEVIQLKRDLERAGFFISNNPTNFFGSVTTAAVKNFQRWHRLNPTGIADHETLIKLQEVIRNLQSRNLLKQGDRLPEVIQLKLDLEKSFSGFFNPTNFYGSVTTRRVREFQAAFNLNPTGVADIITLDTLRRAVNGEILFMKEGDRRPEVIQLKRDLERVGFFISNNPTNFYGPLTTRRVKEFQRRHRLPVDGVAGRECLKNWLNFVLH
ncbi:MAG: peptidoglycan-binding protein, partial [Bacillaceae bacterium]|nr:peptidoglycan-binding protein [Bacillaceae bacterium]